MTKAFKIENRPIVRLHSAFITTYGSKYSEKKYFVLKEQYLPLSFDMKVSKLFCAFHIHIPYITSKWAVKI